MRAGSGLSVTRREIIEIYDAMTTVEISMLMAIGGTLPLDAFDREQWLIRVKRFNQQSKLPAPVARAENMKESEHEASPTPSGNYRERSGRK